jgi:linoleoyl-CoA desaturase
VTSPASSSLSSLSSPTSPSSPATLPRAERLRRFGDAIDAIKADVEGKLGDDDVRYVTRMERVSRTLEVVGRTTIHLSMDPVTFTLGVIALWLHKQLQATEIGHTALHGAYDRFPEATKFHSKTFRWDTPIDEASWRAGHNVRHHGNTNVAGRDPDIHFGPVRLTKDTPWTPRQRIQLPFTLFFLFPNFGFLMNLHFTGVNDALFGNGRGGMDFLPDRQPETVRGALRRAARKYGPYYLKEYVFFPALAGPFFWKVLLGNWLAETMRDVYSAATIYCGHVGEDVASDPEGQTSGSRGEWYALQVEATNDFEVPRPISILCGGLDRQVAHHLFPKLAPERLREVAPAVRAACEAHGVAYKTDTWPRTLRKALGYVAALSRDGGTRAVVRAMA